MLFDRYEWLTWCNQHNSRNQTRCQVSSLSALIPVLFHTHTLGSLPLASLVFLLHTQLPYVNLAINIHISSPNDANSSMKHSNHEDHTPFMLFHQPILQPENKLPLGRRLVNVQPFSLHKTAYLIKKGTRMMLHQEPDDAYACRSGQGRDVSAFSSGSWLVSLQSKMK